MPIFTRGNVPAPDTIRYHVMVLVVLAAIVIVAYGNTLDVPFYFDDLGSILDNPSIRMTAFTPTQMYEAAFGGPVSNRPLAKLTFGLNYLAGGYNTAGYHAFNILVHMLNSILVYALALITFRLHPPLRRNSAHLGAREQIALAGLTAAIFLAHPLATQSVTYVVQRMNSLSSGFVLVSLLLYIAGRSSSSGPYRILAWSGAVAAWICGLASKEIALVAPATILLYEWLFFRDARIRWLVSRTPLLIFTLGIIATVIAAILYLGPRPSERLFAGYGHHEFGPLERVLTESRIVWYYLNLWVFPAPSRLSLLHDVAVSRSLIEPWQTLVAILFTSGTVLLGLLTARRFRFLALAILWYFLHLSIESSFIALDLIYEHRTYLPSVGLAFLAVSLGWRVFGRTPRLAAALALAITAGLTVASHNRNETWRDPLVFWEDVVAKNPRSYRAQTNLANQLIKTGNPKNALPHLRAAANLNPQQPLVQTSLAVLLIQLGQPAEAVPILRAAIHAAPHLYEIQFNLGSALLQSGDPASAIEPLRTAVRLRDDFAPAHLLLGASLMETGDLPRAIDEFERAITLDPSSADAQTMLGAALARSGRRDAGIAHLRRALKLAPGHGGASAWLKDLGALR